MFGCSIGSAGLNSVSMPAFRVASALAMPTPTSKVGGTAASVSAVAASTTTKMPPMSEAMPPTIRVSAKDMRCASPERAIGSG